MDVIISKPEGLTRFTINDVELLIDPIQISIFKEGLVYSWKTLRTKASSKVVNGNAIFHLKLNLIFTKSMFFEMHRLVCQIRNSPYVQIENELVIDSLNMAAGSTCFFTVNSLQLIPRQDSPYTIDMELDLRYFNHKPYGNILNFKKNLESLPFVEGGTEHVYNFDVFEENEGIVKLSVEDGNIATTPLSSNRRSRNITSFLRRSIKKYNITIPVQKAKDSYAYIRYSNYLQLKNLKESFGLDVSSLKSTKINDREPVSLCNIDPELKNEIINGDKIYGRNGYIDLTFQYQKYIVVKLTKEINKTLREHIEKEVSGINGYLKRKEKIEKIKEDLDKAIKDNNLPKSLKDFGNLVKRLAGSNFNLYTGRSGVNNVFFSNEIIAVDHLDPTSDFGPSEACITSFSCGFTNMFSTIPISGQTYPTHQFLGASEPVYNVNILLPPEFIGSQDATANRGINSKGKAFEQMQSTLLSNAKTVKMIPDGSYFSVENFFTKLLGSKKEIINPIDLKQRNNFILRNFNLTTLEGLPGAQTLQMSFCETNDFVEEQLGAVYKAGDENYSKKITNFVASTKPRQGKMSNTPQYNFKNWNTKYFSSDPTKPGDFYYSWVKRGRNLDDITKEQDFNAYSFCKNYLDKIQAALSGRNVYIGSSVDLPKTGIRTTASRHFAGTAVDITVKGMTPAELAVVASKAVGDQRVGIIAYYPSQDSFEDESIKMKGYLQNNFFVHVDNRVNVRRIPSTDHPTDRKKDLYEILDSTASTYYGLDINGTLKGVGSSTPATTFFNTDYDIDDAEAPASSELEENDTSVESTLKDANFRAKLASYINPFSSENEDVYEDIEVKKYSSLDDDEKDIIKALRPNPNSVNPELNIRIITEEDSTKIKELRDSLVVQGINFKEIKDGEESIFYIPESSSNVSVADKNTEAKYYLDMLDNFSNLANYMLTEPELYMDKPEDILKEKQRIKKKLNEDVRPFLFTSFYRTLDELQEKLAYEEVKEGGILGASAGLFTLSAASAATSPEPFTKSAGGIGVIVTAPFLLYQGKEFSDHLAGGERFNSGKILYLKILREYIQETSPDYNYYFSENKGMHTPKNANVSQFLKYINRSDEVNDAFQILSQYVIAESPWLEPFSKGAFNIRNKTKVSAALGTYKSIKKTVDDKGYILRGALSETLFLGEIKRLFNYIYGFPYHPNIGPDEEDFDDLFGEGQYYGEYTSSYPLKELRPYQDTNDKKAYEVEHSVMQIVQGNKDNIDLPFRKEDLAINQEKKLEYLVQLKKAILEELSELPEIQDAIGAKKETSIFKLAEVNAYPDILLPIDPASFNNNVNLHPTFYFYNPIEDSAYDPTRLRDEGINNVDYIIKKSNDFYNALSKGIYSGSESEANVVATELTLDLNYNNIDKLITDNADSEGVKTYAAQPKEKLSKKATKSDVNTSINLSSGMGPNQIKKLINDKKEKFDALNSSFENMFGAVGLKEDLNANNKPIDPLEQLKQEAFDSCQELLKPKKNIKKAFPTYKLYLIEEDSKESDRLSIYDDFYSYSGVKSFTVFSNKKLPTSTAIIELQNISGVLDGTKPEVVRDVDIDQDLLPEQEAEQQINVSSIIMRPGINIQLRAGYESNPNKLDIIFTGRVTEVKNSSAGEMLEIVAQSFGIELINKRYGLQDSDPIKDKTFYNTHSLLGTLLLSEDLKHFGRVKKGLLFQRGENKQISLDMETGKIDEWINFSAMNWVHEFFHENYGKIAIALLVFEGAGNLISAGVKNGSKLLAPIGNQASKIWNFARTPVQNVPRASLTGLQNVLGGGLTARTLGALAKVRILSSVFKGIGFVGNAISSNIAKGLQQAFIIQPAKVFNSVNKFGINYLLRRLKSPSGNVVNDATLMARPEFFNNFLLALNKLPGIRRLNLGVAAENARVLSNAELAEIAVQRFGYMRAVSEGFILEGANVGLLRATFSGGLQPSRLVVGGFSLTRSIAASYFATMTIAALVDLIGNAFNFLSWGFDKIWDERLKPVSLKILLSPQDDNIYPPKPETYLVGKSTFLKNLENIYSKGKDNSKELGFMLLKSSTGLIGHLGQDDEATVEALKERYLKRDNRLSISKGENQYVVTRSTIWEVLHEMSLRHPGFLYGIRKYGDGLESRVFFGTSNQRCFVKDLSVSEIKLLNKIDLALKKLTATSNTLSKDVLSEILNVPKEDINNPGEATNEILDYWIKKTTERFVPFRQYHSVDSEHDIIVNNLRVQANKVINQVAISYVDPNGVKGQDSGAKQSIYQMKGLATLSEDRVNEKGINYPNCKGFASACRYGMGELIHSAKEMYGGEILIVGNPKINTNDICVLTDDYLNMHGLFEVEAVTHIFGYDTGFVTELVPNAVVFGNENYLGGVSSSTMVFDAHRKMIDNYTSYNQLLDENAEISDEILEDIAEKTLIEVFTESNSSIYNWLYRKASYIPKLTDYNNLDEKSKNQFIKEIKDKLKETLQNKNAIFLDDITQDLDLNVVQRNLPLGNASIGVGLTAAVFSSANLRQSLLRGLLAGVGTYGVGTGALSLTTNSVRSGYLGQNIFRDLLLTQIEAGHLVKILPLVKDGKPIVAGGYEFISQHQRYKDVFGNFFNPLSDAASGFLQQIEELKSEYETLGIKQYTDSFAVKPSLIRLGGSLVDTLTEGSIPKEAVIMQLVK